MTDTLPIQNSGLLSRLRLRTRLYGGFIALIAVALALATAGTWGIDRLGEQITKLESIGGNVQLVLTAQALLESIRRTQNRILLDGDPDSGREMQVAQIKAKEVLTEVAGHAWSAERIAIYREVTARLADQVNGSTKLVELARTAGDARGAMVKGGDALTAATDKMMDVARVTHDEAIEGAATVGERSVLLVRVNNWRFLATKDAEGPAKFRTAADQAGRALDAIDKVAGADLRSAIGPVRDALAAYRNEFEVASASILAQTSLFENTLRPMVKTMQVELGKAAASLVSEADDNARQAHASVSATTATQLSMAGAGLVLGLVLAVVIARGIILPVTGLTAAMARLASGDHTAEVPARGNTDEIGDMARAVEVFKQNGIEAVRLTAGLAAEQEVKQRRAEALGGLVRDFESKATALADGLASAATELQATAGSMSNTATLANRQASSVASAAEQMSANIQTVSASAEELGASIGEITRQVAQSAEITSRAAQDAERTDAIVRELSEGAQRIGDVVSLISSIAGQTNLLALNATIEAARAGDAGKGFAVVASEVKSLANQTAKATEDISKQVNRIQTATKSAVDAIQGIVSTIGEVSKIAAGISAAVEEQGAATREIARSVQQAAMGAQDVTSNVSGVSQAANDAGTAASEVLDASGQLSRQAEELSKEVGRFITGVRAA